MTSTTKADKGAAAAERFEHLGRDETDPALSRAFDALAADARKRAERAAKPKTPKVAIPQEPRSRTVVMPEKLARAGISRAEALNAYRAVQACLAEAKGGTEPERLTDALYELRRRAEAQEADFLAKGGKKTTDEKRSAFAKAEQRRRKAKADALHEDPARLLGAPVTVSDDQKKRKRKSEAVLADQRGDAGKLAAGIGALTRSVACLRDNVSTLQAQSVDALVLDAMTDRMARMEKTVAATPQRRRSVPDPKAAKAAKDAKLLRNLAADETLGKPLQAELNKLAAAAERRAH
jgi:hypothetical protein